jgi:hypothetical protein
MPPAPQLTDTQFDFNSKAFATVGAWPSFISQTNAAAGATYQNAVASKEGATSAAGSASTASSARDQAQAFALTAVNAPGTSGTSASAVAVGDGLKTFSSQAGKAWVLGQPVSVALAADPAGVRMYGVVVSYDSGTGALGVQVPLGGSVGSGTHSGWIISLTAARDGMVGRLLGVRIFNTVGTTTYTPSEGTTSVVVEVQAGGGGSAGTTTTTAGVISFTGGGGAGAYGKSHIASGFAGVAVTVGAGGAAGAAGGAGGAGGASSFGSFISTNGGTGSQPYLGVSGNYGIGNGPGQGSNSAAGAQILISGEKGSPGMAFNSSLFGGDGGSSAFGAGGGGGGTTGVGAIAWGSGGGGGAINPSTAGAVGAAGRQGVVIVWEYA